LLSNGSAKKHLSTATREYKNNGNGVFYAVRAEMLYAGQMRGQLVERVELSWLVGELVGSVMIS
jgi:hypothetical protein